MQISGYKASVGSHCDFCSISNVKSWLQTLCSFPMRFLSYFAYKSVVTKPMFVLNTISALFRILTVQMQFMRQCSHSEHRRAILSTGTVFWTPRCRFLARGRIWALVWRFLDRGRILSTLQRFLDRGRIWALASRFLDRGCILTRCRVSSTGVAFWAHWFFTSVCLFYRPFCRFHFRTAYEKGVLHVNSWAICNLITKE